MYGLELMLIVAAAFAIARRSGPIALLFLRMSGAIFLASGLMSLGYLGTTVLNPAQRPPKGYVDPYEGQRPEPPEIRWGRTEVSVAFAAIALAPMIAAGATLFRAKPVT
jgi:hypothetical protein